MREWLTPLRRTSILWVVGSLVLFAVVALLAYAVLPLQETAPGSATERVLNTLLQLRWPVLLMLLMVASLFRLFDTEGAFDPLLGKESRRHRINQQVLRNSIEQFVIFAPAVLGLAILAEEPLVWHAVRIAVILFTLGRILFWVGYHRSAHARAPGFNMTFSTTLLTLGAVFWLA